MFNYDKKIVPKQLNPILTPKLQDEVNFFLKWGYLFNQDNTSNDRWATYKFLRWLVVVG